MITATDLQRKSGLLSEYHKVRNAIIDWERALGEVKARRSYQQLILLDSECDHLARVDASPDVLEAIIAHLRAVLKDGKAQLAAEGVELREESAIDMRYKKPPHER